jgi:hypothetical protein
MATLYITEYKSMGQVPNNAAQMPQEPPIAEQTVGIGGSSASSAAFDPLTRFVRLHPDSICSIKFGQSPITVDATSQRMAANQTEFKAIPEGGNYIVAVITNS